MAPFKRKTPPPAPFSPAGVFVEEVPSGLRTIAGVPADEPVCMPHLLETARSEYAKLEQPLIESEIGDWA
jgi:hypothetical protein